MDRVVILGLIAALSGASASQAFGQLRPFGPAAAPTADLPGASIHSVGPLSGAPLQPLPQLPAGLGATPLPVRPSPVMPLPAPGFVGPSSFDAGGPLGTGSLADMPLPDQAVGPFQHDFLQPGPAGGVPQTYVSPNPTPRAPQNLGLYRPSIPEGIEARKLSPLPSVSVREYPYLRRGQATDRFITPPGMEMPEAVGPTSSTLTWSDRLRNLFDPLGVLPLP
jgi:hypothetical protein